MTDVDLRALSAMYGGPQGSWCSTMVALTLLGSGWSAFVLLPLILHPRTRLFATALAIAIGVQAAVVWALKLVTGRVRPWIALGLPRPFGSPHDGSFPSGHASGSFCVAVFVAIALPVAWPSAPCASRLVGALAVLVAAVIAFSRVYLGAHFPSDAVAGAALGGLVGAIAAGRSAAGARPGGALRPAARRRDDPVEWRAKRG